MDHTVPSRRALIVDDEPMCALDLEAHMHELGFDFSSGGKWPRSLFASHEQSARYCPDGR